MKRTRLTALAAALLLAGCGNSIGEYDSDSLPEIPKEAKVTEATSAPEESSEAETTSVTTAAEEEITTQELAYEKFSKTYQAENRKLVDGLTITDEREGFLGEGYVTGFDPDHSLTYSFESPEEQYYNITVTAAADVKSSCKLSANGSLIGEFSVAKDGVFEMITFENVRLEKGKITVDFEVTKGAVDLDYIKIAASTEIRDLQLGLENYSLSNKNADDSAKELYEFLCENYGKKILTGQHDTVGTLTETRLIYELTGRYPAIRFGDLMPFTQDMIIGESELEYAEKWAEDGGIVSYMWHWLDPVGGLSYYADETEFDLSAAVTEEDIAELPIEDIEALAEEGTISEECAAIVRDIDKVSEKLAQLQEKGIAVIWRPLHEASNGYFWWGRDKASYKWLWKLLYQRQTAYHKLNNLIWVWSAQNASWYVGDKYCDIISADIYDQGNLEGQVESLLFLKKICDSKPIAMSECGTTPSVQSLADQHAMWSFIGQWGGSFLMNEDATLNEDYNKAEELIRFYSNDLTITRDEL